MPLKRKFSGGWRTNNNKRTKSSRSMAWKRGARALARGYTVRRGNKFPVYKFHRYATSLGTYSATPDLVAGALPFTLYPINSPANPSSFPYSLAFTFNDIGNVTEFSNLFDRYMITGVKVMFHLLSNPDVDTLQPGVGSVPSIQVYPRLWYVRDNDDAALTTLASLKEYGNVKCRVLKPNSMTSVYVAYPRTAVGISQTSGLQASGVNKPMWLDCGFPNVNHYGLKFALDYGSSSVSGASNIFRVKIELKYYFKCKDVR